MLLQFLSHVIGQYSMCRAEAILTWFCCYRSIHCHLNVFPQLALLLCFISLMLLVLVWHWISTPFHILTMGLIVWILLWFGKFLNIFCEWMGWMSLTSFSLNKGEIINLCVCFEVQKVPFYEPYCTCFLFHLASSYIYNPVPINPWNNWLRLYLTSVQIQVNVLMSILNLWNLEHLIKSVW